MVDRYIDEGVAELVPGVLFIDEVCSCIMIRIHYVFLMLVEHYFGCKVLRFWLWL